MGGLNAEKLDAGCLLGPNHSASLNLSLPFCKMDITTCFLLNRYKNYTDPSAEPGTLGLWSIITTAMFPFPGGQWCLLNDVTISQSESSWALPTGGLPHVTHDGLSRESEALNDHLVLRYIG